MQIVTATIQRVRRNAVRLWRALRRDGALVSLVALLSLGLLEPLACILHCDLLVPMREAHQHTHHALGLTFKGDISEDAFLCAFGIPKSTMPQGVQEQRVALLARHPRPMCTLCTSDYVNSTTQPLLSAPAPFHAMVLLCTAPFIAALLLRRQHNAPPNPPPRRVEPPPLPPPIALRLM